MTNMEKWYTVKYYKAVGTRYIKGEVSAQTLEQLAEQAAAIGLTYTEQDIIEEWCDTED